MGEIYTLVMAGGRGTRFWPESTSSKPKQYHALTGNKPLLTETLERFGDLVPSSKRYVVTTQDQEKLASDCSKDLIASEGLIFEPSGRNTAPCIYLSLLALQKKGIASNGIVAIVPSDHVILNSIGFQKTIKEACDAAYLEKQIVTIGIIPNFPHTGFGYIQKDSHSQSRIKKVQSFREKPDRKSAQDYIKSGEYLWNAGMFVARIDTLLEEFEQHCPQMFQYEKELTKAIGTENLNNVYQKLEAISIDYAIMEKSSRVSVIEAAFDWNDLGSWDALESVVKKSDENFFVSHRDHYVNEAKGNIVYAPGKFVALDSISNHIIISNDECLLVLPKEKAQDVKNVVEFLKTKNDLKELL